MLWQNPNREQSRSSDFDEDIASSLGLDVYFDIHESTKNVEMRGRVTGELQRAKNTAA